MEQFQVSRTGLLESCQRIFDFDIADKRVFFDAPRQANMHHVDRLLIMLEGKTYLKYSKEKNQNSEMWLLVTIKLYR